MVNKEKLTGSEVTYVYDKDDLEHEWKNGFDAGYYSRKEEENCKNEEQKNVNIKIKFSSILAFALIVRKYLIPLMRYDN